MGVDKREHIMNTAVSLFAVNGFEGTSVRDIAAAADVNLAMISYYFGSKEKLFESIVDFNASSTRTMLDELNSNTDLTSIQKIEKAIEIYVHRLFNNREFHKVLQHELMLNQRDELSKAIMNIISKNAGALSLIIENGIKKKEFRKVDDLLTVTSLTGTINSVLSSKKFCRMMFNDASHNDDYVPYDDENFRKRVINHLKQLMQAHLVKPE